MADAKTQQILESWGFKEYIPAFESKYTRSDFNAIISCGASFKIKYYKAKLG